MKKSNNDWERVVFVVILSVVVISFERGFGIASLGGRFHQKIARTYLAQNELDLAVIHFRSAVRSNPHLETAMIGLGMGYLFQEKKKEATQTFRQVLALSPQSSETLCQVALGLLKAGQETESLQLFRDLVERHPDSVAARIGFARVLESSGDTDGASQQFDEARRLDPRVSIVP